MPSWLTKRQVYYGWVVLAACVIIVVAIAGIRFSFGVFFQSLEEDFGWTRAVTSGVFSVCSLLGCIFAIIGGWVLDRYGAKVVFSTMGLATALGLLLTSQARTLVHLYLSYSLLLAIGTGPTFVVVASTVSRWFTKRRGLVLGIATSGVGLGTVIMTPVAAYLISSYGWRTAFFIMGVIAFLIIIPCAQLLRTAPSEATTLAEGEKSKLINQSPPEGASYNEPSSYTLLQAIKSKPFWLLFPVWFLLSFCMLMVMAHIVRHGVDLGFTTMQATSVLSVIGGTSIAGRVILGRVSDSVGRKQIVIICALFQAGAMFCLIKASSLWMLYLFAIIFGFSQGGITPVLGALIAEIFGVRHLGAILGVIEIGWATGSASGPALAGYLFDISGSYVFAFLAGGIAVLIVSVLVYLVKKPVVVPESRML